VNISLVRVDNRLIHGQILEAWVPFVQASCIIVVDDDVASDFFRETVMRMAVPREIEVVISSVEEFAGSFSFSEGFGRKAILLFGSVTTAKKTYDLGFHYKKMNIGNTYSDEGAIRCARSITFGNHEINDILSLIDAGVQVELRSVPKHKPIEFRQAMKTVKHETHNPG
jgi:PTS system mannose-specific IIB component